ncbi:RNA polymerase sigma-70 factor [Echinicola strongylocentroti]|uniref:RNA polymerase sigma-70 factor n=1 Tax=Echinicola strongylocentroti TaxID=1795355 RepID=A0A2Z4IDD9_9BACT|nr:RNA polymerase sigma-70 factor [Echinicola strongylocentroti]AWW28830.1 RNA polymerase sigma-70 factor [Echinicola strongylocentroti]
MEHPEKNIDEKLVSLLKQGNHLAFQQIYERYWEQLYQSVHNVLHDQALTEDVLHELFTDLWWRREQLEIRNLKQYLARAVRNGALLKLRNNRWVAIPPQFLTDLSTVPDVELDLDHRDLTKTIEAAIDDLPERCKVIFQMSRFEHYSIPEIAQHFNISHRTVENQLHRALKHLKAILGAIIFQFFHLF